MMMMQDQTPADVDGDGFTSCNGDCNDFSFHTYPGAAESSAPTTCMTDVDGDGYGAKVPAEGATMGTDCDDENEFTFPWCCGT